MTKNNKELIKISLTREDVTKIALEKLNISDLNISRFSSRLLLDLLHSQYYRIYNVDSILDQIRYMEGLHTRNMAPKAQDFKHLPLKGFSKVHFNDAQFIIRNLQNHFGIYHGGNKNLDKVIDIAFKNNNTNFLDETALNQLIDDITINAYLEKAHNNKLTGEWIIFKKYHDQKYYLTIASHNENDHKIFDRIQFAIDFDFPFLACN